MFSDRITRRTFGFGAASFVYGVCHASPLKAAGRFADNQTEPSQNSKAPADVFAVDLSHSKHARLRSLPLDAVTIRPGFWASRIAVNRTKAIPEVYQEEVQNGRVFNFQRLHDVEAKQVTAELHSLRPGADSEVYKWLEAAGWGLISPDADLQAKLNQTVQDVVRAQEGTGYLDTYFVGERVKQRMTPETQIVGHEVYSMGHLIQAGIAIFRVTGDRTLLDSGLKFVDGYLLTRFGPEADKAPLMSGHAGPEMMLVELYRETGEARYLELAGYLLQGDDRIPLRPDQASYTFAGRPFTGRTVMEGHAVRAAYACCGAADYALETVNADYVRTLKVLWDDMVGRQMYITGAIGATIHNEAFGGDYFLPNQGSYCESCANIAVLQWAYRLLSLTGEARYGDVMERVLYNSVNSGIALDGLSFNYRNPLLYMPDRDPKMRRPFWYVNCCAPNLNRTFSSLQSCFYSSGNEGLYVNLYGSSQVNWHLSDGTYSSLSQSTTYPWAGRVDFDVSPSKPVEFTLFFRIPAGSETPHASVNDVAVELVVPGQYLALKRTWSPGDKVRLELDMTPRLIRANDMVEADKGRFAVQRGPLVYCMESIDQLENGTLDDFVVTLDASSSATVQEEFEPQLLGGIVSLRIKGQKDETRSADGQGQIYSTIKASRPASLKPVFLKLIPYYAFANREESAMQVWLP